MGPFKVMQSLPSDHKPLVRVLTGRGDRVNGVPVHPDRLTRASLSTERQFFEPMPGVATAWSVLEDGDYPGHFGLSGDELDELAKHCSRAGAALGSQPLRPTEFDTLRRSWDWVHVRH